MTPATLSCASTADLRAKTRVEPDFGRRTLPFDSFCGYIYSGSNHRTPPKNMKRKHDYSYSLTSILPWQ